MTYSEIVSWLHEHKELHGKGGYVYYADLGEIRYKGPNTVIHTVGDWDTNVLEYLTDLISSTVPPESVNLKNSSRYVFEASVEVPVVSGDDKMQVGSILAGKDVETGLTMVMLSGFAESSMAVLAPVLDAEGSLNTFLLEDLRGYSQAINEMAGNLEKIYFKKQTDDVQSDS